MQITNLDNTVSPVAGSATAAAASMTASLPGAAGRITYIEGFDVTGGGATAASVINLQVTGVTNGPLNYGMNVLAGVTGPVNAQGGLSIRFPDPIPASAGNSSIGVTLPSLGSGNTEAAVTAYGFQK